MKKVLLCLILFKALAFGSCSLLDEFAKQEPPTIEEQILYELRYGHYFDYAKCRCDEGKRCRK